MTTIDYSVWDHIEVSDDEDDTHPNIDTPSLFRWRHQARVDRMEAFLKQGEELEKSLIESRRRLEEAQRRVKELKEVGSTEQEKELSKAQAEEKQLRKEERSWQKKMEEHRREEKKMPWNVDTLSKEGFSKKHALMQQVAHQTIVMQFILELAKSLKVDPRGCFRQFFTKIKTADQQYQDAFNDELESFKERVRGRAKIRIDKAMKEYEEEERQKRLGPGGLDPVEVYESLPAEMQKCFDDKDIQMLQDAISKMDPTEAKLHMKRCIDSGLWVPNSRVDEEGNKDEADDPQYEEVKKEDQ
ncbi:unnamed protein product [Leuciscus chuanchicus]